MLKSIVQNIMESYNKIIQLVNNYEVSEPSNLYGHSNDFIKLKKEIKSDAHRVISPLALKFAGIEDIYSVTDINGNTYKFDIFEDGNYRVIEVERFSNIIKEDLDERNY